MEKIEPGKYIELIYDLYKVEPDGKETLVHQVDVNDPEKFVFGVTPGVIVPLEKAIEGLEPGGKFDLTVKSNDAFGPYDQEQIATLEKEIFEIDGKFDANVIKPGAVVPMMTADGYRISGIVKEVTDKNVVMDFNHPLAGKDVRFKGEIKTVRQATPEELKPAHGCGCGCNHEDCGEGGCDSSCHCEGGCKC